MTDHRLLVVETELVSAFKVASRDGNTLSAVIRAAWDTGTLRTLTRHNPLTATDVHISIIGHITAEELLRHLDSTEAANGFGNRFLWFCVRRSKLLPDGGNLDPSKLAPHIEKVRKAIAFARHTGQLNRDPAARDLWHQVYAQLSEGESGLVGSLLARAEAQVIRLSMLYALLDHSNTVREPHLRAALELWGCSDRSVRHLFGDSTGNPDADLIQRHLTSNGDLTRTRISGLFGRHASADRIDRAIQLLETRGVATLEREDTGGRPLERLISLSSLVSQPDEWPSPPSEDAYHGLVGDIVRTLEPHTEADPVALLAQLLETVRNHLVLAGLLFKTARRWRWVHENPLELVETPAMPDAETETIDATVIADLIGAYRGLEQDPPDETEAAWFAAARRMTVVALSTGLRRGELLGLRWMDVDLLERRLSVRQQYVRNEITSPKSKAGRRSISLGPVAVDVLEEQYRATRYRADDSIVFSHPALGTPLDPSKLGRHARIAMRKAGVPDSFRPWHGLRHTALTETAAAGVPGMFVQAKAGHAHGSTTERYLHAAKTSYPNAAELAEERLFTRP